MIDKGLYKTGRVGLRGGADAATASFAKSAGFGQKTARADPTGGFNLSGGRGPTFGGAAATQTSGDRGRESRQEFIDKVRKTNPRYTGGPPRNNFFTRTLNRGIDFANRGIGFAKRNPLQILLSAINPVFGAAMLGASFLNKPQFRERFTGYETQAEYDQARQDRINRNTIATLENTIQKKYLDKGRSLTETDLDERLASLKEAMGIQDTAPNVMTGRDLNLRGIETLDTGNNMFSDVYRNIDTLSNMSNAQDLYERDRTVSLMKNFIPAPGQTDYFPSQIDNTGINFYNDNAVPLDPNLNIFKVKDLRAELTDKQKRFIDSKKFPLQENLISPQSVFDTITNPDLGIYDTGTFGFGAQEPTTEEEYNDYLRSLGLTQTI